MDIERLKEIKAVEQTKRVRYRQKYPTFLVSRIKVEFAFFLFLFLVLSTEVWGDCLDRLSKVKQSIEFKTSFE